MTKRRLFVGLISLVTFLGLLFVNVYQVNATTISPTTASSSVAGMSSSSSAMSSSIKRSAQPSNPAQGTDNDASRRGDLRQSRALAMTTSQGRDISNRLTSLTVTDRDKGKQRIYDSGSFLKVEGAFCDQAGSIKGGDYIKITWSNQSQNREAYLQGFSGSKPLYVDNVNVGQYVVTADGATLTFNDNVNDLRNVCGTFSFMMNAFNYSNRDQTLRFNNTSITVAKRDDSPVGPDVVKQEWRGDKTGSVQTYDGKNWIAWGVYLNSNRAQLDGVVTVHDEIPDGLTLDTSQTYVWLDGNIGMRLDEFKTRFPKSSIKISGGVIDITIDGKELSGHKLSVAYRTEINDADAINFTNNAQVAYQLQNEQVETTSYSTTVFNVTFDATVTGTKPNELKIIKYLEDKGSKKLLPGVTFEIRHCGTDDVWRKTTDDQGMIDMKDMPEGDYEIREVAAPQGIDLNEVKDKVWIVKVSASQEGKALQVVNHKVKSIPWTDYSDNLAKVVIPWTDYSDNLAKTVIPWTDYSNNLAKVVIPWTDYSDNLAKTVIPWTDYSNNLAKVVIPWTDYSDNLAKVVIPWTDYSDNLAKTVIPWTDYSNNLAKVVIPWTDYSDNLAKTVIPWTDYSKNSARKPGVPAKAETTTTDKQDPKPTMAAKKKATPVQQLQAVKKRVLPQTGEQTVSYLAVIGIVILGIAVWFLHKQKQRN